MKHTGKCPSCSFPTTWDNKCDWCGHGKPKPRDQAWERENTPIRSPKS